MPGTNLPWCATLTAVGNSTDSASARLPGTATVENTGWSASGVAASAWPHHGRQQGGGKAAGTNPVLQWKALHGEPRRSHQIVNVDWKNDCVRRGPSTRMLTR